MLSFGLETMNSFNRTFPLEELVQPLLVIEVCPSQLVNLLALELMQADWRVGNEEGAKIKILFCTPFGMTICTQRSRMSKVQVGANVQPPLQGVEAPLHSEEGFRAGLVDLEVQDLLRKKY